MADSVEQLYKAQDLQDKLYPITKENAVKDNNNVSLDTKLTSINTSISNKLEAVKINNTALPITDKAVNITIDSAVSETSTNAVQNKTIKSYVDTAKEEVKEDISNSVLENLTSGSSLKLYAQETLADQEFTYRQSPTEEDGYAKITDIKGNTIVWNQLVQNGNFASTSGWTVYQPANASINANSNVLTETLTISTLTHVNAYTIGLQKTNVFSDATHKYLCFVTITLSFTSNVRIELGGSAVLGTNPINANTKTTLSVVSTAFTYNKNLLIYPQSGVVGIDLSGQTIKYENIMLIDLTLMFGAGNEPITVEEFTSLFPLPYYDYNQGSLLSFNGNGIKTVGKNLLDPSSKTTYDGKNGSRWYQSQGFMLMADKTYTFSVSNMSGLSVALYIVDHATRNTIVYAPLVVTYTPTHDVIVYLQAYRGGGIPSEAEFQLEIGSQTEYEPYTSSTLSLPISTYFPTGMKSAGTVYDELLPTKAITRLKKVTYSNSTGWTTRTTGSGWNLFEITPSDIKHVGTPANETIKNNRFNWNRDLTDNNTIRQVNQIISIRKDDIKSLSDWNTYLASNPLEVIYELATPTETSFTTALEMRYPAYAGGTEQILPENSSTPTTAPIIADIEYSYDFKAVDRIIGMLNSVAQNETSPSTHNYSVGDYLVYKYQLYKVIASISTGASLTVGTNIQATTIMNELASLS